MPSKIKAVAAARGVSVRQLLEAAFVEHKTQPAMAKALGVTQGTISLWLARLGLRMVVKREMTYFPPSDDTAPLLDFGIPRPDDDDNPPDDDDPDDGGWAEPDSDDSDDYLDDALLVVETEVV